MAHAQRGEARGGARTMWPRWLWATLWLSLVQQHTHAWRPPPEPLVITPQLQRVRQRRDLTSKDTLSGDHTHNVRIHGWLVELEENNAISVPYEDECKFYKGKVNQEDDSKVAVTECAGQLYGLLQVRGEDFVLQPTVLPLRAHVLRRRDVTLTDEPPAYNLTGDAVTDLELQFDEDDNESEVSRPSYVRLRRKGDSTEYSRGDVPVYSRPTSGVRGLWLEMALVADHTVMKFHGRERVKHYILALINIVSAIFNDQSLNANVTLVINKLFLYEEKDSIIKYGNVKKSLEAVNKWNYKHLNRLPSGSNGWDVAVWLTRAQLGGPSGFAPVGGVCTRARSAAVNRDEGLTSAFVIAHELAHLLGLTHDGDGQCDDASRRGSVMATTVLATLHKYAWSSCSKKQFHEKSKNWWCMHERSHDDGVVLGGAKELSNYVFTMDEQCRTEFGEGFSVCKSVKLRSPCARLWCAHRSMPQVCRSKRAPPLEGTPCGLKHWCVDRICEPMPGNADVGDTEPKLDNENIMPHWEDWSDWSKCDVNCGYGLRLRTRQCKTAGSSDCEGPTTQAATCWSGQECAARRDVRQALCRRHSINYIPYWPDEESKHCEIWCVEFSGGGNGMTHGTLPDGTPCSYERPYDLCFQGACVKGHCNATDPACNWCADGYCNNNTNTFSINLSRKPGWTRLVVIPYDAHQLNVQIKSMEPMTIAIREKGKNKPMIELNRHNRKRFEIQQLTDNTIKYDPNVPQNLQIIKIDTDILENKDEHNYGYEGQIMVAGIVLKWKQTSRDIHIASESALQSDLMILGARQHLIGDTKDIVTLHINYSTPASRTRPSTYRLHTERGQCSVSCGGGQRWVRVRCIPGISCAPVRYERCNTHRCEFTWAAGEWEECSGTCGDVGVQERQLFCVPVQASNVTRRTDLIMHSVSPALCSTPSPEIQQACNRLPCPVYWEELPWTPCSTTCGRGISLRPLICPAHDDLLCGPKPQERRKRCRLRRCPRTSSHPQCTGEDASQYCKLSTHEQLERHCTNPSFRRYCCSSCRENDNTRMKYG